MGESDAVRGQVWPLVWQHGDGELQARGGMTGPIHFRLPSGRTFSPLAIAPWYGGVHHDSIPGHLHALRGVFPCLPFGASPRPRDIGADWATLTGWEVPDPAHGAAANGQWHRVSGGSNHSVEFGFDHPDGVVFCERQCVRGDPRSASFTLNYRATSRRSMRLPFGYHVLVRWPLAPEPIELRPGAFGFGLTYPGILEPGYIAARPNDMFDSLDTVPSIVNGVIGLSRPDHAGPLDEVVQLCGVEGVFEVLYPAERAGLRISWDARVLPSCLLWFSRFGLKEPPWQGRFTAIGIEPIAAAFDFAPMISLAANPISRRGIATAVELSADRDFETSIGLSAFEW